MTIVGKEEGQEGGGNVYTTAVPAHNAIRSLGMPKSAQAQLARGGGLASTITSELCCRFNQLFDHWLGIHLGPDRKLHTALTVHYKLMLMISLAHEIREVASNAIGIRHQNCALPHWAATKRGHQTTLTLIELNFEYPRELTDLLDASQLPRTRRRWMLEAKEIRSLYLGPREGHAMLDEAKRFLHAPVNDIPAHALQIP